MSWVYLFIAGLLEVAWAIGLKYTNGWTKLWPSVFTIFSMIVGFYFLSLSLKTLPIGTAYAVWTGIGTVGTAVLGVILFHESSSVLRMMCISFIVMGIVGLKVLSPN